MSPAERIKRLMQIYKLSSTQFADEVGLQRSSISHILSGRNKPSLEVILKIVESFPEVNLYWLTKGEGNPPDGFAKENHNRFNSKAKENYRNERARLQNLITPKYTLAPEEEMVTNGHTEMSVKKPVKTVIFYSDGTFDIFENNKN